MSNRRSFRILSRILVVVILATLFAAPASALSASEIRSGSACLVDASTGEVLFAKDEDTHRIPASLTKLMTVYLVYEAIEAGKFTESSTVPISSAIASFSINGTYSNVPLYTWGSYTVSNLLDAVMVSSACAATRALALMVNSDEAAFVQLMNDTALALGMDAHYVDTFGGSYSNYVTAEGMAILCHRLYTEHPEFLRHSSKRYYYINGNAYYATNQFIKGYYSSTGTVDGIKTGTNGGAGYCLCTTAYDGDLRVISVTLNALYDAHRYTDSEKLLNYGLAELRTRRSQGQEYVYPATRTVTVGSLTRQIQGYTHGNTFYMSPVDLALMLADTCGSFSCREENDRLVIVKYQVQTQGQYTAPLSVAWGKTGTGQIIVGAEASQIDCLTAGSESYYPLEALLSLLELPYTTEQQSVTVVPEGFLEPFRDVTKGAWYSPAVSYVYENNYMNGTEETAFAPNMELSRAMMAQILYNLEGRPEVEQPLEEIPDGEVTPAPEPPVEYDDTVLSVEEEPPVEDESPVEDEPPVEEDPPVEEPAVDFTDVVPGSWYEDAVLWAASEGLVMGRGDGIFDPDASITRQEMVAMLFRYHDYLGLDASLRADISGFSDSDMVMDFALESVRWAVAMGVINGSDIGTLMPLGTATRCQVAQVLMNYLSE